MWENDDPRKRFMQRLIRERAIEFMQSPEYLKKLRFDYDRAKADQKLFGEIWGEYGTSVFQLIAEAHGETWDAEDDEKMCVKKEVAINQRVKENDDDLAGAREESARERLDLVQGEPEESLVVLEEGQGRSEIVLRSGGSRAEEAATTAAQSGRRRGNFYRLAGGTCTT